jgi:hypothetical protein
MIKTLSFLMFLVKSEFSFNLGTRYVGCSKGNVEDFLFRDVSFTSMRGGYMDQPAPPMTTKIQISDLPQNEYYVGLPTARSLCHEQQLSSRSQISNVKVADFLNTETKTETNGGDLTPSPAGKRLQVSRLTDRLGPGQSSPTCSASPMLHRACTPVTEIENSLPPVGQTRFEA